MACSASGLSQEPFKFLYAGSNPVHATITLTIREYKGDNPCAYDMIEETEQPVTINCSAILVRVISSRFKILCS